MRSSGQLLPTWTKKKTFITAENKRNIRTILHQRQILSRHLLCLSVVKLEQLGFIFFLSRRPIWNWKTGGAKAPVDSWSRGRWAVWSVVEPAGSAFSCALCEPSTFVAFLEKLMSQDFIWCELQTKWQVMWRWSYTHSPAASGSCSIRWHNSHPSLSGDVTVDWLRHEQEHITYG